MRTFGRFAIILCATLLQLAIAQQVPATPAASSEPLYMKVELDKNVKTSCLKAGDTAEGSLVRDVYSSGGKVFAAGTRVRLTVDHVERRRRTPSDRWPWVVKVLLPRHENVPGFGSAAIRAPGEPEKLMQVSVLSAGPEISIHAENKKKNKNDLEMNSSTVSSKAADEHKRSTSRPIVALEARALKGESLVAPQAPLAISSGSSVTLPAGTTFRILLLDGLMSSKNRTGDSIQARLLEPIVSDRQVVLPVGSLFRGSVTKTVAPRWLSRSGSLSLSFTSIDLPDGTSAPISASLAGVEVNHMSHARIDAEGRLRGERPGAAWMLINGGAAAGLAKVGDDGAQLLIEALVSTATDVSTAGTGRIVGAAISGVFFVSRRGRDAILPSMTEMDVVLNRPVELSGHPGSETAENANHSIVADTALSPGRQ